MKKIILHLSDLHYRHGWIEEQGVVLDAFFKDLNQQINLLQNTDVYLIFSGDIVQSGEDSVLYDVFFNTFHGKLNDLGIFKSNRIIVPGNHDVSRAVIEKQFVNHEGVIAQKLNEMQFNNYISNQSNVFTNKFFHYIKFEKEFATYGSNDTSITGAGWNIDDDFGIFCLNSAICSSGGLQDLEGRTISDKGRLAVNTRNLYSWNQDCKAQYKILVMHHPLDWLTDWAKQEVRKILNKDFTLCLSGHAHNQSTFHTINKSTSLVECSAPPLFTKKNDELGYSFVSICPELGITDITYRQWTKYHSFVTGVNFSGTDNGKIVLTSPDIKIKKDAQSKESNNEFIERLLTKRLDDALLSFSNQPKVWIEPVLSKQPEYALEKDEDKKLKLSSLISKPTSTIIKAPPQFGLTCLAHHLVLEAWRDEKDGLWLYFDAKTMKHNFHRVKRAVKNELELFKCEMNDVTCIILDSWTDQEKSSFTLLQNIFNLFCDIPVIVMQMTDDNSILDSFTEIVLNRKFEILYLWSLPRSHVRKVVTDYNEKKHVGDDDSILSKVVTDLEVLNLHRTPLNCLTLLKVSEIDFDESPVNRTEMLKRVLFLLFNVDDIPTYKVRPDLKDCEYVLGYFCETMIRKNEFLFSREYFLKVLQEFCESRVIDLEVEVIFDVLHYNNILVKRGSGFSFRFTFWIYYFAAQRMHHDDDFASFIFHDMRYVSYPEMIEFYTGIDRRREDALKVLINDVKISSDKVKDKSGLPNGLNPYKFAKWRPSEKVLEKMQTEIKEGVKESKLPDSIKDRYADRYYDPRRPYYQEMRNILHEYSLAVLFQAIKAASRALRNSDYVKPDIKRQLLEEIMNSWEQISKVLLVLTPLLAENKMANFDGTSFLLCGDFGDTPEARFHSILSAIPNNIISWFKDDLFSQKMGPLLIEQFNENEEELRKHVLILLIIKQRPRRWKLQVQNYIGQIEHDSFYLMDVYRNLCTEYSFSFASPSTLKDIEYLIKMTASKHFTGNKKPGSKAIKKISDKVIPERIVD
jgi:predicted MPP superfamily phosphohydrolase